MGPKNETMTAKIGLNVVMGPKNGTMTAVYACDETGASDSSCHRGQLPRFYCSKGAKYSLKFYIPNTLGVNCIGPAGGTV